MNPNSDNKGKEDSLVLDFSINKAREYIQESILFKIHVYLAVGCSLLTFVIWSFLQFAYESIPWFFFIFMFFVTTLTIHYYYFIRIKEWLQLHIILYGIINFACFCIWLFTTDTGGLTWFIYIIIGLAIPLLIHFRIHFESPAEQFPFRNVQIHQNVFILFNLLVFIIYLQTHDKFPYFIFIFLGLSFPLAFHWYISFHYDSLFVLHKYFFVIGQTLVFAIWITTGMHSPWFIFVLIPGSLLLSFHHFVLHRKDYENDNAYPSHTVVVDTENEINKRQNANITVGAPIPSAVRFEIKDDEDSNV